MPNSPRSERLPAPDLALRPGMIPIITNNGLRDWSELLAGDQALTTVIQERLPHCAHLINISNGIFRLYDLEQTPADNRAAFSSALWLSNLMPHALRF